MDSCAVGCPRKWNGLCWLLLILWCLPSVFGNLPFDVEIPESGPIEQPDGTLAYAYDQTHLIGWPFVYLAIHRTPNNPVNNTFSLTMLLANVVTIGATLAGIVFSAQTFIPKFSIKTLLVFVTLIALLFPIGNVVFATDNYFLHTGFMMAIYFAPLIASVPAFIYSRTRKNHTRQTRDNK